MIRAFQWDLARQVERLDWLLAQLTRYADWGYQELYLHLEDAVEYPRLPGVARPDAYSYRQLARLVTAADRVGIKVVPIVNLLGHTQYLIKVPELRDLNELRHPDGSPMETGQICPLHPRTLEIAEKLLRDMAPFCTAGKVHVGLDESFQLGRHPLSQKEIKRVGLAAHFAGHVGRLRQLTRSLDLEMGMWADMLYFLPDAIELLPADISAYDWYYYPFKRHPRVELFNFVERDLATRLKKHGIATWGCPMNGAFRHEPLPHFHDRLENIKSWWRRCQQTHAAGMLVTSWEPNRLAMETTTLVDAAAAQLWLNPGDDAVESMLTSGLKRVFASKSPRPIARALLAADAHAFTGYPRWEINKDWAQASGGTGEINAFRDSLRFFTRLRSRASTWPTVLQASLDYRGYLARRDLAVREGQTLVISLRQSIAGEKPIVAHLKKFGDWCDQLDSALDDGLTAARKIWLFTRDPKSKGPNEAILAHDRQQLKQLRAWLMAVHKNHRAAFDANPLLGHWQCTFEVRNLAPGALRIDLSQKIGETWHRLKSCHTIEFMSTGAQRRHGPTHLYSAPIGVDPVDPETQFRLSTHGTGLVAIADLLITDGLIAYRPKKRTPMRLGTRSKPDQWSSLTNQTDLVFQVSRTSPALP